MKRDVKATNAEFVSIPRKQWEEIIETLRKTDELLSRL